MNKTDYVTREEHEQLKAEIESVVNYIEQLMKMTDTTVKECSEHKETQSILDQLFLNNSLNLQD